MNKDTSSDIQSEAGLWCLETYWKDGRRTRKYEDSPLQKTLLQAGVLISVGGRTKPKEVRFFHDSMQSYLTAFALCAQDDAGYLELPKPTDDHGNASWDRCRVLFRIAGYPPFANAQSDTVLNGGSELFQMFLSVFTDKTELCGVLRKILQDWAKTYNQNLRQVDFQSALPKEVADQATSYPNNLALLMKAIEVGFAQDTRSSSAKSLGTLYGCLAPLVWILVEDEGKKASPHSPASGVDASLALDHSNADNGAV